MRTDLLLEFADGEYPFKLSVENLLELQDKCGTGIGALFARLLAGRYLDEVSGKSFGFPLDAQWSVNDLLETIRLALIGGGMEAIKAKSLVNRYCYPSQPLKKSWDLAVAILTAVVEGVENPEETDVKKKSVTRRTRKVASTEAKS
jgi:hypothetical protein